MCLSTRSLSFLSFLRSCAPASPRRLAAKKPPFVAYTPHNHTEGKEASNVRRLDLGFDGDWGGQGGLTEVNSFAEITSRNRCLETGLDHLKAPFVGRQESSRSNSPSPKRYSTTCAAGTLFLVMGAIYRSHRPYALE
jgi:hypothetical protein